MENYGFFKYLNNRNWKTITEFKYADHINKNVKGKTNKFEKNKKQQKHKQIYACDAEPTKYNIISTSEVQSTQKHKGGKDKRKFLNYILIWLVSISAIVIIIVVIVCICCKRQKYAKNTPNIP